MTDKEKLHQILSSLWKNDDSVGKMCYNQALQDVQTAIDLQEEPVSEDLEESAQQYAKDEYNHKNPATLPDRCIGCYAPIMYAFKTGAKWQKEKSIITACNWLRSNVDCSMWIMDFYKMMED